MIDNKVYDIILNNYDDREKIAKENNIPLCFLYTRLAKEKIISYSSSDYLEHVEKI